MQSPNYVSASNSILNFVFINMSPITIKGTTNNQGVILNVASIEVKKLLISVVPLVSEVTL